MFGVKKGITNHVSRFYRIGAIFYAIKNTKDFLTTGEHAEQSKLNDKLFDRIIYTAFIIRHKFSNIFRFYPICDKIQY